MNIIEYLSEFDASSAAVAIQHRQAGMPGERKRDKEFEVGVFEKPANGAYLKGLNTENEEEGYRGK